jgi:hypothetical protein
MNTYEVPSVLQVWGNTQKGMTSNEIMDCLNRMDIVNKALERCFRGEITFMDWLDIADYHGIDVDRFLDSFERNLKIYHGIDVETIQPDYFYLSD